MSWWARLVGWLRPRPAPAPEPVEPSIPAGERARREAALDDARERISRIELNLKVQMRRWDEAKPP